MSYQLGPAMSSAKEALPQLCSANVSMGRWGPGLKALDKFREAGDKTGEAGVGASLFQIYNVQKTTKISWKHMKTTI